MQIKKLDFMIVSSASVISSLLTFGYNIITRRYIVPYDYGIFVSANLLLLYYNYLQLGVLNSYNRDYPQLLGSGKFENAKNKKNVVWTFLFIVYGTIVFISTIVFIILWHKGLIEKKMFFGLITNSILSFLTIIYGFYDTTIRSDGNFAYSAYMLITKTIIMIVIGILIIMRYGIYGLFIAPCISIIALFAINIKFFINLNFIIDLQEILTMIGTGLPLLINNLVWALLMSIDRFIILAYMTMTDLGIYSVALLGFSTLVIIPQSISQIFYIKMSQVYGATQSKEVLFDYAVKFTRVVSLISTIISIVSFYILPIIISCLMPKYQDGVVAAQILIFGVALYSTSMLFSNLLNILKLNIRLLISTCLICVFAAILSISFIHIIGKTINSVALGTSLSFILYSFVVIYLTCKFIGKRILDVLVISWAPVLFLLIPNIVLSVLVNNIWIQIIIMSFLIMLSLLIFYRDETKSLIMKYKLKT